MSSSQILRQSANLRTGVIHIVMENGEEFWFGYPPDFKKAWILRPGDDDRIPASIRTLARRVGVTEDQMLQMLKSIWHEAENGTPIVEPPPIGPRPPDYQMPPPREPPPGGDDAPGKIEIPDPLDPPPREGRENMPPQLMSSLGVAIPSVISILRQLGFRIAGGVRIPWNALPGWARTALVALGAVEGADFILDVLDADINLPGLGSGTDPHAGMIEAMTVSTWTANGVRFHRLSDGRLATKNKHGVWKVWRPKKPIVIMSTGPNNINDVLRADAVLQKQAKKITKVLKNRGWKVSRT